MFHLSLPYRSNNLRSLSASSAATAGGDWEHRVSIVSFYISGGVKGKYVSPPQAAIMKRPTKVGSLADI